MNHIHVGDLKVSKPVQDMLDYLDMFFTELLEAEKLSGSVREEAFVATAHAKYGLMTAEEAVNLSKGIDVID